MEQLIARLVPPGVSWALARCGAPGNAATERELELVVRAVTKRREEFVAGRSAARSALARYGLSSAELLSGRHRAPSWPRGIVGSITHAGGMAVAAVAPRQLLAGIGIDLEQRSQEPLPTASIIGPAEQRAMERLGGELGADSFLAYFSAKEAIFKAMYPRHRRYFDFLDVVLEPGADRTFRCRALPAAPVDPEWPRLRVKWNVNANFVFSTAFLPTRAVDDGSVKPG